MRDDSGLIVIGWLTKLVMTLAVIGLIAFDGISIVASKFSIADHANTYASDAADQYHQLIKREPPTQAVNDAYAQAVAEAKVKDDVVDARTFTVAPNGEVTLTVTHTAKSLWLHRVSFLKKYLNVSETGTGIPAQ